MEPRTQNFVWIFAAASVLFVAGGCTGTAKLKPFDPTPPDPIAHTFEEPLEARGENGNAAQEPSESVLRSLLPPISEVLPEASGGEEESYAERRFDVAVNNAPARDFFIGMVEDTPYNMVLHPDVAGEISLHLKNVTVRDVLDTVRDIYGYDYRETPQGFQVLPVTLQTRVFTIDYLSIQRSGRSQTRVNAGQSQSSSDADSTSSDDDSSSSGGGTSGSGSGALVGLTEVNTESESDFWPELVETLEMIIGPGEGRSVNSSPQANLVTVRAFPHELRDVEAYLSTAQGNLQRQVHIEAKILEVQLSDRYQQGINWGAVQRDTLKLTQTGGGTSLADDDGLSDIAGQTGVLDPRNLDSIEGALASAFGGVFTLQLTTDDFTTFIELLKLQGDVEVLSSPRISTLNNQKAVIKVGSDEFFVTEISTTTVTGTATTTTPDVTLTPFFSGIALDVTPQIAGDDEIILHVHPSVSQVTDQVKTINLGGDAESLTLPLALTTVRESDSIVRAASGQVIVIGGLMEDSLSEEHAKVPILGDIPYLGALFRQTGQNARKTELVILLRPEIIEGEQWAGQVRRESERFSRMKRGQHRKINELDFEPPFEKVTP